MDTFCYRSEVLTVVDQILNKCPHQIYLITLTYIYFKRIMCVCVFQDLSSAMKEVEELTAQLHKQQQQSQQTAQELEQLRKVHTHTHTAPLILVSQRACPVKRRLVMASLQLWLQLTKKESSCSQQHWNCWGFSISRYCIAIYTQAALRSYCMYGHCYDNPKL